MTAPHAPWCAGEDHGGGPCPPVDHRPEVRQQQGKPSRPLLAKPRKEASPRQKHDDSGPALDKEQLRIQRVYIDVEADVRRALVRLRNAIEKRPMPLTLDGEREALAAWLRGFKSERKAAGL